MMRSVLVAGLVLVTGCGGEKPAAEPATTTTTTTTTPATPPTPATTTANSVNETAIGRMKEFADAMCACADAACAQRVVDEQTAWASEFLTANPNLPKKSADERKRTGEIATQMTTCMRRVMNTAP